MRYAGLLDGKPRTSNELHAAYYAIAYLYANLGTESGSVSVMSSNRHERLSDYVLNLAAGHESTAYLLGTVLSLCMADSEGDQDWIQCIVREAARFDSPIQIIGRFAKEDFSWNKRKIRSGDRVFLHIGAANRDDRVYERPHLFDPKRSGPPLLSFGLGQNSCVASGLALREASTFLSTLSAKGWSFEIDHANVRRVSGLAGRSFRELPAALHVQRPPQPLSPRHDARNP